MSLQIWNPFKELYSFESDFDRFFRGFADRTYSPLTDVKETDKEIIIKSELPGFEKNAINIEVTTEYVEISSENKEEKEKKDDDGKVLFKERSSRKFFRRISFSSPVDPNKAKSSLKDGILTLEFQKVEPEKAVKLKLK
ncbi:MAG: Hsp20/alpha crystallin family protein [Candidatus Hodarchaeales archaeon]|jgi:HSP20 family protein